MNQSIHSLRLMLCFFSGEDDFIIRKCNKLIQFHFAFIGLLVLIVFVLCWISAAIFMSHVFAGARWLSAPIGIIWALLVTNLYLLLLYTISPALLPVVEKKLLFGNNKKTSINPKHKKIKYLLFSFSFLARICFIIFLAIVVVQPFNVCFFTSQYDEADRFAASIQQILHTEPLSRFITFLFCGFMLMPVYLKYRVRAISRKKFENDFETKEIVGVQYLREQLGHPTDHQQLVKQILSADINAIRTSDFYFQKTLIEYRIVLEEYQHFKIEYSNRLKERISVYNQNCYRHLDVYLNRLQQINTKLHLDYYNQITKYLEDEAIDKYEYWADPPFRTSYKTVSRKLEDEAELLKTFYPEN